MDRLSSCYFCGVSLDDPLQDYPLVSPESDDPAAVVTLCPTCHQKLETVLEVVVEPHTAAEMGIEDEPASTEDVTPEGADEALAVESGEVGSGTSEGEAVETAADVAAAAADAADEDDEQPLDESGAADTGPDELETEEGTEPGEADTKPGEATMEAKPATPADPADVEDEDGDADSIEEEGTEGDSEEGAEGDGEKDAERDAEDAEEESEEEALTSAMEPDAPEELAGDDSADVTESDEEETGAKTGDDEDPVAQTTVSALEYNKVMRLLQNREFPVDHDEIVTVAANAYELSRGDVQAVVDLAVDRDLIGREGDKLVRPEE